MSIWSGSSTTARARRRAMVAGFNSSSLICLSTILALVGGSNAQDRPAQSNLAAADWKRNLTIGANGPIPAIVIDQFGYPTKSKKVAVIRTPEVGYDASARF